MAIASNLAQQALNNLVNQFARPMDFLRELVQNAIDAGTPRVEVWMRYIPPPANHHEGVLEIHIDDFGEGMDERIIDEQLTKMFSSTKEDDLTKIGKFGIGFTSIFAIHPEAVLLHTGRHGEFWELLFHADRTFDKVRVDKPVQGTKITLLKPMEPMHVEKFIREARWILHYWCEHSNTPITFWDRTQEQEEAVVDTADPFAAFGASQSTSVQVVPSSGAEQITGPMALDAPLFVERIEDDIHVLIGYNSQPRFGFYNGGLTLLNTRSTECLGKFEGRMAHLSFKVKSDKLEHTLTRDNVIQDEHWQKVMGVLLVAANALQERLLEELESAAAAGQPTGELLTYLAQDCRADANIRKLDRFAERVKLLDHAGTVQTLEAIDKQANDIGTVLLDPGPGAMRDALLEQGLILLPDSFEVHDLLRAAPLSGLINRNTRTISHAERVFVLPQLIDESLLPRKERKMVSHCASLIRAAVGKNLAIRVGEYGGQRAGTSEPLALEGPEDSALFLRPEKGRFRWPLALVSRTLFINRNHPFYQAQIHASDSESLLAAYSLAMALLHEDGFHKASLFQRMMNAVSEEVVGQ